jgi:hypothetical protein
MVLAAAAAVYAVYLPVALLIASNEVFPLWPQGNPRRLTDIQKHPERGLPDGGFAYVARAYDLRAFEDGDPKAQKSPIIIYENDKPLGPAHSDHYDVEKIGLGRYSHGKDLGILFSTSDNSDPNNNGRAYFVVVPSAER